MMFKEMEPLMFLEPKEAIVEDEPIEKEESQPIVEIPAPKELELTKFDEVKSKLVNLIS